MSEKMIEIKNVSKWYGPVQVLNDCSVSISKGDVVAVSYTHLTLPTILLV